MAVDRITLSNTEQFIKGRILDFAIDRKENYTRIFYFGIVISNEDPLNANRIKVRIPFLDDNFYVGKTKAEGDETLPWCLPMNRNFVATPEQNSVVVVAIMDPKVPYFGRVFLDSITSLEKKDIFDASRLAPENKTYDNWTNVEQAMNILMKSKPKGAGELNVKDRVKYDMGIRGKGKNRVKLTKDSVEIYQNEGDKKKESMLKFTKDVKLEAAEYVDLLSKKGGARYHPVFDEPLYDYLQEMNDMIKEIVKMLNSKPSTNTLTMTPDLPSPDAPKLISKLQRMNTRFHNLTQPGNGSSKYLYIN